MPVVQAADAPPLTFLSGYKFLRCVARTPLGEVWQAQVEAGSPRLITLYRNVNVSHRLPGGTVLDRLRALQHEGLAPTEYVVCGAQQLAAITVPGDSTLAALYKECQDRGGRGIPRAELLSRLRQVAQTLDDLERTYCLQHLGLTPNLLLLRGGQVHIADFGVAELLWRLAGRPVADLNPRYGARELFEGRVSPRCDQYSLALIYQEMLTGCHPFGNAGGRRRAGQRLRAEPDLDLLPAADRPALRRALHPNPEHRFVNCAALVTTLEASTARRMIVLASAPGAGDMPAKTPVVSPTVVVPAAPTPVVSELVLAASRDLEVRLFRGTRFLLHPGRSLHHHCFARLLPGTALIRLDGFRQQWQADLVHGGDDHFVFRLNTPANFWQRCLGRVVGLEVEVRLAPPAAEAAATEISVTLRPVGLRFEEGAHLLRELGPMVLDSLRQYLQVLPERRRQERLPFEQTVQVSPVFAALGLGAALVSQTQDISYHGMGLYLPCQPVSPRLAIQLPDASDRVATLPAQVVRAQRCGDGRFNVGVLFQ